MNKPTYKRQEALYKQMDIQTPGSTLKTDGHTNAMKLFINRWTYKRQETVYEQTDIQTPGSSL